MFNLTQIMVIAAGGAIGAVLRFWVSNAVYQILGRNFPYGTLAVNVIGSFLMGFLAVLLLERFNALSVHWRAALLIGFLGSFTTFSTFSLETLHLLQQGEFLKATGNILFSVFICLLAVWLGAALAKWGYP